MLSYVSPCLLVALISRALIFGAYAGDALAIAAVAALFGFEQYLHTKVQAPLDQAVRADLSQLKDTVNSLKVAMTHRTKV